MINNTMSENERKKREAINRDPTTKPKITRINLNTGKIAHNYGKGFQTG